MRGEVIRSPRAGASDAVREYRPTPGRRRGGPGRKLTGNKPNRRSRRPRHAQTNLFFKNIGLSYSTSAGPTWGGVVGGLKTRKEVRSLSFGPAPQDSRLTPGAVPPATRAGQNLSPSCFCRATIHFTDYLSETLAKTSGRKYPWPMMFL